MTEVVERENYAELKWYANCAESGTEGFWWKEEYALHVAVALSKFFPSRRADVCYCNESHLRNVLMA